MTDRPTGHDHTDAERLGLPPGLLDILVCPVDHAGLEIDANALRCTRCGRRYPVRDGIPSMIVEDAQ